MACVWSKELETGNQTIDTQHKQLIQALNNLMNACAEGKGRAELDNMLNFLTDYTIKHFTDEENMQIQHEYPNYNSHKVLHETFKKNIAELADELKKEGPTIVLVGKLNSRIGDWLLNHIKREDMLVAAHVRERLNITLSRIS